MPHPGDHGGLGSLLDGDSLRPGDRAAPDRRGVVGDGPCETIGELGMLGVPALMFHEGHDAVAEHAFREIARLTRGAYCHFDSGSAETLSELLRAAAVYAAGGVRALSDMSGRQAGARLLLQQLR